jgi:hypothetical protein
MTKSNDTATEIKWNFPAQTAEEVHGYGIRIDTDNPDHHIWDNNGTLWLNYVVYPTPVTAERRRISLKTKLLEEARFRRDRIFEWFASREGVELLAA